MRDRNLEAVGLGLFVRPGEDVEIAGLAAVPMALHRGDLDWLMLERVEAVLVAQEQLQRCQHRQEPHRHAQHGARFLDVAAGEQIAAADREHHEPRGEVRGVEHVRQPVGEARIEHDRGP